MMRLPCPPVMRHDVCRDRRGPGVAANGARGTTRGAAGLSAARRGPAATTAAAARGRAVGLEALPDLESCQGAPRPGGRQAFCARVHREGPRPPHDSPGVGPPGTGDRARPAGPTAPGIVLQADRALGRLNAARAGPAAPGPPHARCPGSGRPGQDPVGGQVRGSAHMPPAPHPAAPTGRRRWGPGRPAPVLPAWPLRPGAGPPATVAGGAAAPRRGRRAPLAWGIRMKLSVDHL
jgi:hypothetical protein